MKVVVIAIGQKLPDWANTACEDYLRRFPKDWNVEVKALKAEDRNTKTTEKIMQAEAERIPCSRPVGVTYGDLDFKSKTKLGVVVCLKPQHSGVGSRRIRSSRPV